MQSNAVFSAVMTDAPAPDPRPTRIVLGSFTPSVLLALARRTGSLDAQGLEVEEVAVASSPGQFGSLRDGELDMVLTSPDNVLAYRFAPRNPLGQLLDVSIVSAVDRGMGLALYGRPGLTDPEQLRGATLGVDVPTSGFALAMYAIADSLGVSRDEYELVAMGSTPKRMRALLDGECDATMLNAGNELPAEAAGCVRLASASEVCPPYLGTVLAVLGEGHRADATLLAAALRATALRVVAGELEEEAVAEAAATLGLTPDLAARYAARLRDPDEGLTTGPVDVAALGTLVSLRGRYLPEPDGSDPLAGALEAERGLVREEATA
jgi:ABC-type nitrate/sulfonate/bicarbonate transport system substrate-binding protein